MSSSISTINVPFHGNNLYVVNYNGEPHVPMKPIVEGMGLDWKSQFSKIKSRFSKGMVEITIPTKGGEQSMICLALRKLAGWLHTISPNKVKPEIREKVIQYQEECDDVLYEYWATGEVKAKANTRQSTAKELTPLRQTAERLIATGVGNIYPDIWKYVHKEFGVKHINELLPEQIPQAISFLDALEGEYLPKENKPVTGGAFLTDEELLNLCYVWNDSTTMIRNMLDIEPLLQVAEHRLAGSFYEKPRDAMRKTNALRRTIERATQHIQIKRNEMSAWNILHRIRIPDMPW
ncbi:phage antirepressor N-terminal domain-containing protein [Providencia alcalifaciens]|uniref:phage antirepressor N-terminal domain-containing protein n=1 Tax=Providencia alcalifaciens TaxID=126385 RepID=UPI00044EEF18|nr:phage antirepressor N-terminal domain-containing protein [Providencia alcalifaciens]EUD08802.1 antirepressor N-terminal domain protein [Providencia alcalifaciens R90-1475]